MEHFKWLWPPLILGFILGETFERYLFISIERYGDQLVVPTDRHGGLRPGSHGLVDPSSRMCGPTAGSRECYLVSVLRIGNSAICFPMFMLCLIGMGSQGVSWNVDVKIVPMIVGAAGLFLCVATLFDEMSRKAEAAILAIDVGGQSLAQAEKVKKTNQKEMHMDIGTSLTPLPGKIIAVRVLCSFSGWPDSPDPWQLIRSFADRALVITCYCGRATSDECVGLRSHQRRSG